MKPWRRLERRWLGLPPARSRVLESNAWMPAPDGTRLLTRVLRPADSSARRGTVLIRTERPVGDGNPLEKLGRWLAEDGRSVLLQSCRGRGDSEGRFRPFADEVADGGAAVRWALSEFGHASEGGPLHKLVLLGLGYSAFTAWAALAAEPERVTALAVGFGARDPYAWLHRDRVLQLEAALALAARLDGREGFDPDALDLARAAHHRPLAECDRVAIRELDAFREWIAHGERDDWWAERTPSLPEAPPPTLIVGGWYECAFPAAYADYTALVQRAARRAAPGPALVLGPWGAAPLPREERGHAANALSVVARSMQNFVARAVGASALRAPPARVFVRGAGWREASQWPPESTTTRTLYLHGAGSANSLEGDGRLESDPPAEDGMDSFVADPADPVPSLGGAAIGGVAGPVDRQRIERRGDVLCFTSEPLARALELVGQVVLTLYTDPADGTGHTSVKLAAVDVDGSAHWLCEGIARHTTAPLVIDLGAAGARLASRASLRLEIAGSSLPRFARSGADDDHAPCLHVVYHDALRPSALRFEAVD